MNNDAFSKKCAALQAKIRKHPNFEDLSDADRELAALSNWPKDVAFFNCLEDILTGLKAKDSKEPSTTVTSEQQPENKQ